MFGPIRPVIQRERHDLELRSIKVGFQKTVGRSRHGGIRSQRNNVIVRDRRPSIDHVDRIDDLRNRIDRDGAAAVT